MKPGHVGFLAGTAACCATLAYDIAQTLQIFGILRFPIDEIAIYLTSLCIVRVSCFFQTMKVLLLVLPMALTTS